MYLCCCLAAAPLLADEGLVLPEAEYVSGYIEDDGRAVLLFRPVFGAGQIFDDVIAEGSFFLRLGADGSLLDAVELPETRVRRMRKLRNGRIWLTSVKGPLDNGGYGAWTEEVIEILPGGDVKQVWSWDNREWPNLAEAAFEVSPDGEVWAVAERESGDVDHPLFDRVEIRLGDFTSRKAVVKRRVAVHFDEPGTYGPWDEPEPAYWFSLLDSEGPVLQLPWAESDDGDFHVYTVHIDEDDEASHPFELFPGDDEWEFGWQGAAHVLWSATKSSETKSGELRAYHLPDLGLSGPPTEPYWQVEGWEVYDGGLRPRTRGLVGLATRDGQYRIDYIWRDPLAPAGLIERSTGWHEGTLFALYQSASPGLFHVSPNGTKALVLERCMVDGTLDRCARILDMTPMPSLLTVHNAPGVDAGSRPSATASDAATVSAAARLPQNAGALVELKVDDAPAEPCHDFTLATAQRVRFSVTERTGLSVTGVPETYSWERDLPAGEQRVCVGRSTDGGRIVPADRYDVQVEAVRAAREAAPGVRDDPDAVTRSLGGGPTLECKPEWAANVERDCRGPLPTFVEGFADWLVLPWPPNFWTKYIEAGGSGVYPEQGVSPPEG